MGLEHKVALLTGGTGGLGTAVTEAFLENGATTIVIARREATLAELSHKFDGAKGKLHAIQADILDEPQVTKCIDDVRVRFGRIDFLINTVGGFAGGKVEETSAENWDKMMDLNAKSVFLCCKHVAPVMRQQKFGRIVNIGGRPGLHGTAGLAAYAASKAGLANLTETLAAEMLADNINVNMIVPSTIDTEANRKAMPNAAFDNWVKPESLARVILFLCTEAAQDISGATIPVYGKA